jgi:hypothetical protein
MDNNFVGNISIDEQVINIIPKLNIIISRLDIATEKFRDLLTSIDEKRDNADPTEDEKW